MSGAPSTSLFDGAADVYARARPEYPAALWDALDAMLPERTAPLRAVEIGPGTGQATGALLARGVEVCAVELGPVLASKLRARFRRQSNLEVVNAAFEDAHLEDGAWDLVVSATAYHWVRGVARMRKPHALLAPGGVFAVVDTIQVRSEIDRGYFERSQPIYARYWPEQPTYQPAPAPDEAEPPVLEEMRACGLFVDIEVRRWRWDQVYGTDTYMDLVRSYSNTNELDEATRERFLADLRAFVGAEPGGSVLRPLVITLVTGRRP